jgi:arylsulfatase A
MSTRRQFLAGSAAAVGAVSLPSRALAAEARPAQAPDDRRQPNIVLILHDDLGYGETGPYGQKVISTPNIDALAAQGLRFTSYYGGGCTCAPSRSVALTGLHLGHATVRQNPENGISVAFADTDVTFANILKSRGYATAAFGKWGFGPVFGDQPSHPNERGFDEFFGYISHTEAHNYYPPYLWHNAAKFPLDGQTYALPLFADRTIQFIKDNSDGPFLVYLAPNLPHLTGGRHRGRQRHPGRRSDP